MTKDETLKLALEIALEKEYQLRKTGQSHMIEPVITAIKEALAPTSTQCEVQPEQEPVELEEYDAGLLNDYGGGNVEWWQDYIRAELGRAYEHYQSQATTPPQPEQEQKCWCTTCRPITMSDMRFVVCPDCGNKRCPKANDHRNACTGSNEVGQNGSSWEHVKPLAQPEQEPVELKWQQAPIRTVWGDDMVVASVAIDNDHTLSLYCERDQTPKIDAMFAHPQQEPVAWKNAAIRLGEELSSVGPDGYYDMTAQQWLDWAMEQEPRGKNSLAQPEQKTEMVGRITDNIKDMVLRQEVMLYTDKYLPIGTPAYTTPPKRPWGKPWVSLTDELGADGDPMFYCGAKWAEAKLKEKNAP